MKLSNTRITIIGLGLIGGSLALALRQHSKSMMAVDLSARTRQLAVEQGLVDAATDDLIAGIQAADLVIFATPVRTMLRQLKELRKLPQPDHPVMVMDVGSTKTDIMQAMMLLPDCYDPIGAHPMAGREWAGVEFALADLFENAAFAITPLHRTSDGLIALAKEIIATVGANCLELTAARHDRIVAMTSHLPYLVACATAHTAGDLGQRDQAVGTMMAGGFRDTTRVAASDITMMSDILFTNKTYVKLALAHNRKILEDLEEALDSDPERMLSILEKARADRVGYYPPPNVKTGGQQLRINGNRPALQGTTQVPGDKSISHRAIMHAALSPAESKLLNVLRAGETNTMIRCLIRLGVSVDSSGSTLTIRGGNWRQPRTPLDCENSAATLRLLMGALAGQNLTVELTGTPALQRHPMRRLAEPLRAMGAEITGDSAPLVVKGQKLRGITHTNNVASAQVKAALLLAALHATGPTTITEPGPSRNHTEHMLGGLGVDIEADTLQVSLRPSGRPLPPTVLMIPNDFSSAAPLICAAAVLPGSDIVLERIGINLRRAGLLKVLRQMGSDIQLENEAAVAGELIADIHVKYAPLTATDVSGELVVRMIDEFPALAVVMSQAAGTSTVRDAAELRLKESDRISALRTEFAKLGVDVTEYPDGFAITGPQSIQAATLDSHGDHRLTMALAIAGLLADGQVIIENADVISESFPTFADVMRSVGAEMELD